jgi:hypothetical protein
VGLADFNKRFSTVSSPSALANFGLGRIDASSLVVNISPLFQPLRFCPLQRVVNFVFRRGTECPLMQRSRLLQEASRLAAKCVCPDMGGRVRRRRARKAARAALVQWVADTRRVTPPKMFPAIRGGAVEEQRHWPVHQG